MNKHASPLLRQFAVIFALGLAPMALMMPKASNAQVKPAQINPAHTNPGQTNPGSTTPTPLNACEQKFHDHGGQAVSALKKQNICIDKRTRWGYWKINDVSWGDYFACLDKSAVYTNHHPNTISQCSDYHHNNWILSSDHKRCVQTIAKIGRSFTSSFCFQAGTGKDIGSSEFDQCFSNITPLNLSLYQGIQTCSGNYGQEISKCASSLSSEFDFGQSWSFCRNANIREASKGRGFLSCFKDAKSLGLQGIGALNMCAQRDSNEIIQCLENNKSKYDLSFLQNKCQEQSFRDAVENPYFDQCVANAKADGIAQNQTLEICETTRDEIELYAKSREFKHCKDTVMGKYAFSGKNAYMSCSEYGFRKHTQNYDFMKCFEKGLGAGLLKYFTHRAKELDGIHFSYRNRRQSNPYYYVIENCEKDESDYRRHKDENGILKLWKDYNIHSNTLFIKDGKADGRPDGIKLGGLSALRFEPLKDKVYFLSDDKGYNGDPRIYVYDYQVNKDGLKLKEDQLITFSSPSLGQGKYRKGNTWRMDPEGLDFDLSGNIIVSSEISDFENENALTVFSANGEKKGNIPVSESYIPKDPYSNDGMQFNKGFESLSLSPNKQRLFIANEGHLKQDKKYNFSNARRCFRNCYIFEGEVIRIAQFVKSGNTYGEDAQFFYRMENEPDNGVSEILSLDEDNLLVLERSWDSQRRKITARIFHVNLKSAKTVSDYLENNSEEAESGKAKEEEEEEEENAEEAKEQESNDETSSYFDQPAREKSENEKRTKTQTSRRKDYAKAIKEFELAKTLVLDLDDIIEDLAPGFRRLENFEGLAIGPKLPNGSPSLALIADNNFSLNQRTLLLILEINQEKLKALTQGKGQYRVRN